MLTQTQERTLVEMRKLLARAASLGPQDHVEAEACVSVAANKLARVVHASNKVVNLKEMY